MNEPTRLAPRPLTDLTTEEAYTLAVQAGTRELPDWKAIENEDWGRDFLLQFLAELPAAKLAEWGIVVARDA